MKLMPPCALNKLPKVLMILYQKNGGSGPCCVGGEFLDFEEWFLLVFQTVPANNGGRVHSVRRVIRNGALSWRIKSLNATLVHNSSVMFAIADLVREAIWGVIGPLFTAKSSLLYGLHKLFHFELLLCFMLFYATLFFWVCVRNDMYILLTHLL